MFLTNYDLYDIYAVFVLIRAYPEDEGNAKAVAAVKEVVDAPQGQFERTNAIRACLGNIPELDREKWFFIDTQNVYTYIPTVIRDETIYAILSSCPEEMLEVLKDRNKERIYDLAEGKKNMLHAVKQKISCVYRPKWHKDFLKPLL